MKRTWDFWANWTIRTSTGQWWLAVLGDADDMTLHRMGKELSPINDAPLCAAADRLKLMPLAAGPEAGMRFQVAVKSP